MQIIQFNVIAEIPFNFSQKYQTVGLPRPNRRATVYFGTQLSYVGCIGPTSKHLNVDPANRPAFCRQVPIFYAKCPSKNILQVGRSVTASLFGHLTPRVLARSGENTVRAAKENMAFLPITLR